MSLENFRKLKIRLDKANQPIIHKQITSEGDRNGRQLEVQLTNRYVLESQENVQLTLYWKHLRLGNQGMEPFETANASDGIFEVSFPQAMLNEGNVDCYIQIRDGNHFTNTRHFTVVVKGTGFDAQTVVASDDYKALNDALAQIRHYQDNIDEIMDDVGRELEKLRIEKENDLNDLYNSKETKLDNLHDNKASKLDDLHRQKESKLDSLHDAEKEELDALQQDYAERAEVLEREYAPQFNEISEMVRINSDGNEYRWGFHVQDGHLVFVYEEV